MLRRSNILVVLCGIAFLFLGTQPARAQLKKSPLQRHAPEGSKSSAGARTKTVTPLALPFWDDFSFTDGDTPKEEFWVNSNSVWVNEGIAYEPPTIYAATFDGLDSTGLPYSAEITDNGYRDKLESAPILLDLPEANRTSVFLSFFYQWQGNGEAPDDEDFLVVEFKDTANVWVERYRIQTSSTLDKTVFYYVPLLVSGDRFFHDDFQFRFRTFGRLSGPYDTWNIDYVYLNDFRDTFQSFPDRALASEITSFFGEYRAIPLEHFRANPVLDSVAIDSQNLKDSIAAVGYDANASFRNYFYSDTDTTYTDHSTGTVVGGGFVIFPKERATKNTPFLPDGDDPLQFDPDADALDIKLNVVLRSDDAKDFERTKFEGIDLRINDTLSTIFKLHDYYAYDDGTAEYTVDLGQSGDRALVEFEMATNEKDFLIGFDIYLPDYGVISNQSMDFIIYHPDGDGPSENPRLTINRSITRQGEGNFFKLRFDPGIEVQNKFYVGWTAPSVGSPKIGVDASNNTSERIFTNPNGTWLRNQDGIEGSIMIRPFFGEGNPVTGIPQEEKTYTLFPNPNRGEFYVRGNYNDLSILSSTGQSVSYQKEDQGDSKKISFHSAPGVYIVRIAQGTGIATEKIIVVP